MPGRQCARNELPEALASLTWGARQLSAELDLGGEPVRLQQAALCYFGAMPRSFAALARTARCSSIDLANSAGPPGLGTWAVMIRRSLMRGSASITVLMSAAMRSRISSGIVGGPNNPPSPSIVSAGYPASATVGMSGIAEARALLVT